MKNLILTGLAALTLGCSVNITQVEKILPEAVVEPVKRSNIWLLERMTFPEPNMTVEYTINTDTIHPLYIAPVVKAKVHMHDTDEEFICKGSMLKTKFYVIDSCHNLPRNAIPNVQRRIYIRKR